MCAHVLVCVDMSMANSSAVAAECKEKRSNLRIVWAYLPLLPREHLDTLLLTTLGTILDAPFE